MSFQWSVGKYGSVYLKDTESLVDLVLAHQIASSLRLNLHSKGEGGAAKGEENQL